MGSAELNSGYMIVDDFCGEVEQVVQSVFDAGFSTWLPNKGEVGSSIYEGMGFWGEHAKMLKPIIGAMCSVIIPNTMFFRNTNKGMEKAYIHSDREAGSHTCIAYLSEHEEKSGTAFYKHIPTGLTRMPSFKEMQETGVLEELKADMVSRDESKWELMDFVEGKYNRALIFEAPLFHSRYPLEGIGDNPEDGRLIWASHFYKLNDKGELV